MESAALDGVYAGFTLAKKLGLFHGSIERVLGKDQKSAAFTVWFLPFIINVFIKNILMFAIKIYFHTFPSPPPPPREV